MSGPAPIPMRWTGEAMQPLPRFASEADRSFVIGKVYRLVEHQERSQNSHAHYFAALHEAWQNLPENLADQFPTPEHFRKRLLIKAGYRDERSIVCGSKAEAQRVAAFVKPMDEYAVVTVSEAVVRVYTAQSQSMRAMGKAAFQDSKQKVLDLAAEMIGVAPGALSANAARAA